MLSPTPRPQGRLRNNLWPRRAPIYASLVRSAWCAETEPADRLLGGEQQGNCEGEWLSSAAPKNNLVRGML